MVLDMIHAYDQGFRVDSFSGGCHCYVAPIMTLTWIPTRYAPPMHIVYMPCSLDLGHIPPMLHNKGLGLFFHHTIIESMNAHHKFLFLLVYLDVVAI